LEYIQSPEFHPARSTHSTIDSLSIRWSEADWMFRFIIIKLIQGEQHIPTQIYHGKSLCPDPSQKPTKSEGADKDDSKIYKSVY